jgi:hypothetical protein
MFFRDPFRLVPIENIAEIADKFTRNEIMTSNEMRQVVGMAPHPDPKADQLLNSNMPQGSPTPTGVTTNGTVNAGNGHSSVIDLASLVDKNDPRLKRSIQNGS